MNILHVIPGLSNSAGPTHVVINLSEKLARLGNKVAIFYLTGRGCDSVVPAGNDVRVEGFPVTISKSWCYSPALRNRIQELHSEIDVIHIHSLWLYPNVAATAVARKQNIPYILRPIGSLEPWCLSARGRWKKRLYMSLVERGHLEHAAAIHVTSEQEAANIVRLGIQTKTVVVPNGVNFDEYDTLPGREIFRRRFNIPFNKKIIPQVSELINIVIYRLKLLFYGLLIEKMPHEIITLFYQMPAVLLGAVNNRAAAQRSFVP